MSQHDFNIANQTFPSFRADLNDALVAAATMSAGSSAPTTPYAYQLWFDTSTGTWKVRNSGNTAWISTITTDLATGNVGIGVTPEAKLHISTGGGIPPFASSQIVSESTGNNYIELNGGSASTTALYFGDSSDQDAGGVLYNHSDDSLSFRVNAASRMLIDSSGSVGISTAPSGAKLEIFTGSTSTDGLKINRFGSGVYYSTLRQDSHGLAIRVGDGSIIAERVAITPNGITFNGDTAAANALDDYEEGTWTPVVGRWTTNPVFSGSPNVVNGKYVKIGRVLHVNFYIQWATSNVTSIGSGGWEITGLPFGSFSTSDGNFLKVGYFHDGISDKGEASTGDSSRFQVNYSSGRMQMYGVNAVSAGTSGSYIIFSASGTLHLNV